MLIYLDRFFGRGRSDSLRGTDAAASICMVAISLLAHSSSPACKKFISVSFICGWFIICS